MVEMMAEKLSADVLAYEYVGYSIASGSPSEDGCYASAEAAYTWALRDADQGGGGAASDEIVPFGRSLGSAPACYIAARAPSPVAGLLLQSPLLSGANAVLGRMAFTAGCVDVFRNNVWIEDVRCRVAIAHGTADGVVPCSNGRALYERCADAHKPLWCQGYGHNNMPEERVFVWASAFLSFLRWRARSTQVASHATVATDDTYGEMQLVAAPTDTDGEMQLVLSGAERFVQSSARPLVETPHVGLVGQGWHVFV